MASTGQVIRCKGNTQTAFTKHVSFANFGELIKELSLIRLVGFFFFFYKKNWTRNLILSLIWPLNNRLYKTT